MNAEADRHLQRAEAARREGRANDALQEAQRAVECLRVMGGPLDLAKGLRMLGECARASRPQLALESYEAAVGLLRGEDVPLLLAHTVRHLGDVHVEAGRMGQAEPCYREALALYRAGTPPELDLANALRSLAVLMERTDPPHAIPHWKEARDLYAKIGVEAGVDEATARLDRL